MRQIYRSTISFLVTTFLVSAQALEDGSLILAFSSPYQAQQASEQASSETARLAAQLRSPDEEERRQATIMLIAAGTPEAASVLALALNDSSARIRAHAITGLATLSATSHVPLIIARLSQDKVAFVRKSAAYALGRLQSAEATPALVAALKDKDNEVRGAAAVALGEYQDQTAIPALIGALRDKHEFVRAQAARALGVNGRAAAQAVPSLVKLLTSDKDHEVKRRAATALGLIGERSALPALERAQHSSDPYLSQAAIEAANRIQEMKEAR